MTDEEFAKQQAAAQTQQITNQVVAAGGEAAVTQGQQ
jgi:hypothetical protein